MSYRDRPPTYPTDDGSRIGTHRRASRGVSVRGEYNQYDEPMGSDPRNRRMGLTPQEEWDAKFAQAPGWAPPGAGSNVQSPASAAASEPDPYSFAPASRQVHTAPAVPVAPVAMSPGAAAPRARFPDMNSVMESRVPGWGGMDPTARRAALQAMPKSGAMVGQRPAEQPEQWQTPGGPGGRGVTPAWLAAQGGRADFKSPYGTASVSTPQRVATDRILADQHAGDAAAGAAYQTGGLDAVAPPSIGQQRKRAGMTGGAATRRPPAAGAPAQQAPRSWPNYTGEMWPNYTGEMEGMGIAEGIKFLTVGGRTSYGKKHPALQAPQTAPRHGGTPGGVDPMGNPVHPPLALPAKPAGQGWNPPPLGPVARAIIPQPLQGLARTGEGMRQRLVQGMRSADASLRRGVMAGEQMRSNLVGRATQAGRMPVVNRIAEEAGSYARDPLAWLKKVRDQRNPGARHTEIVKAH